SAPPAPPEEGRLVIPSANPPPENPLRRNLVLPATAPDGQLLVHAGKYSRMAVLSAFEMVGGTKRMAEWADENYGEFLTGLFAKTIQRDIT
ncbi:hypothetical protein LAJ55_13740, partial [Streptococcus pneumoniae]|uniref:hypothetical protein n=1 Tax=Streptococcus pneumoniae TaxID=1313 RepID=UPI001CBE99C3